MVKGICRQVIVVHSPDPKLFEQAIFILKDDAVAQGVTEELLLQEEGLDKTANDLIFVGHLGGFLDEELSVALERLRELCRENSPNIGAELAALVTTYHPERAGV